MARATNNVLNPQVLGAGADGDAVVPGSDGGVLDDDIGGELDMDAVGVGAVAARNDVDPLKAHILGGVYHNVEHLAV